jgi:hypothetical protein
LIGIFFFKTFQFIFSSISHIAWLCPISVELCSPCSRGCYNHVKPVFWLQGRKSRTKYPNKSKYIKRNKCKSPVLSKISVNKNTTVCIKLNCLSEYLFKFQCI